MNVNLERLWKMMLRDDEETMSILMVVHAHDTNSATTMQASEFHHMHLAMSNTARNVIRDFTSQAGLFNINHVAWQLGIDTTAAGPSIPNDTPGADDGSDTHVCVSEDFIYEGHYAAPGTGISYKCSICSKMWVQIGDQYHEAEAMAHILTLDDVR